MRSLAALGAASILCGSAVALSAALLSPPPAPTLECEGAALVALGAAVLLNLRGIGRLRSRLEARRRR
jgi:hypothetical protein